ncbi:MAG: hypothetical protein ACR2PL_14970 [Dehalococcoidia bacterium]
MQLEYAAELGARVVRAGLSWRLFTENPTWYIQQIIAFIGAANAKNLKIIFIFGQTPCQLLADPGLQTLCRAAESNSAGGDTSAFWGPPSNPDLYDQALKSLIQQIRQNSSDNAVLAWEIWNEPNARFFWEGCASQASNPDAAPYVRLLSGAYNAVHNLSPRPTILGGSLSGGEGHESNDPSCFSLPDVRALDYLTQMYTALGCQAGSGTICETPYGALSLHPNADTNPPDQPDRCGPATSACPNIPSGGSDPTWDVSNDGAVDTVDALCILRSVAGLPDTVVCPALSLQSPALGLPVRRPQRTPAVTSKP